MRSLLLGVLASSLCACATFGLPPDATLRPDAYSEDPLAQAQSSALAERDEALYVGDGECVPYGNASRAAHMQEMFVAYGEAEAASARGWRRLNTQRVVMIREGERLPIQEDEVGEDDARFVGRSGDHLIDSRGRHWMILREHWPCSPGAWPEYYIDAGMVFTVEVEQACGEVLEARSCGGWPVGGCGTEPMFEGEPYVIAMVPADARKVDTRSVRVELERCVAYEPEGGYEPPP